MTLTNVWKLFAPRSTAASIRLPSSFNMVVYIGSIINGRKSYVIPITELRNGWNARLPSITVSTSLSAVILSVKLIHIGSTNIMTITDFLFISLLASIYAIGYASSRHTRVVTMASRKLYARVPMVFGLVKNPVRLSNVNLPSPLVKA